MKLSTVWLVLFYCSLSFGLNCFEINQKLARYFRLATDATSNEKKWPSILIPDEKLPEVYPEKVEKLLAEAERGRMEGKRREDLGYAIWKVPNERGRVSFAPGVKMSYEHLPEVVHDLMADGFSVYMMDPLGQGHSQRMSKNPQMVHIDSTQRYYDNQKKFIEEIVKAGATSETTIDSIGYSMGGLIQIGTESKYPGTSRSVVTLAPALDINTRGIPKFVARGILWWKIYRGQQKDYALFMHDMDLKNPNPDFNHSKVNRELLDTQNMIKHPDLTMGGPSNGWVNAMIQASDLVPGMAARMRTPTLLIRPDRDRVVLPSAITNFANISTSASLFSIPQGRHHFVYGEDRVRHLGMTEVLRYLVNPERLDAPAKGDEVSKILKTVERYESRGDVAMARYAMDEAIRTYEAKRGSLPNGGDMRFERDLLEKSAVLWARLENTDEKEQGLYLHLSNTRERELEKLYGDAPYAK